MMKRTLGLIAAVMLLSLACVKQPDWIESTLVTADVTGRWDGTVEAPSLGGGSIIHSVTHLELEQEGPRVKGMLSTSFGRASGPLEGRVGGDVFRFSVAGSQSERLTGEVTVSGDEMEGLITFPASGAVRQTGKISVRRAPSSPRPSTLSP